jgi:hypothetical protein
MTGQALPCSTIVLTVDYDEAAADIPGMGDPACGLVQGLDMEPPGHEVNNRPGADERLKGASWPSM